MICFKLHHVAGAVGCMSGGGDGAFRQRIRRCWTRCDLGLCVPALANIARGRAEDGTGGAPQGDCICRKSWLVRKRCIDPDDIMDPANRASR